MFDLETESRCCQSGRLSDKEDTTIPIPKNNRELLKDHEKRRDNFTDHRKKR